jgi:hypothetical protein
MTVGRGCDFLIIGGGVLFVLVGLFGVRAPWAIYAGCFLVGFMSSAFVVRHYLLKLDTEVVALEVCQCCGGMDWVMRNKEMTCRGCGRSCSSRMEG